MKAKAFGVLLLALLAAAAGYWGGGEVAERRAAEEARKVAEAHRAELAAVRAEAEAWAEEIARRQGDAVLRAFVAGIAPAIRAERRESLEISALSLLRIEGVAALHVVAPDGRVLWSSDAKVTTTGAAGESGSWALGLREIDRRPASRPGVNEVAIPVTDGGRPIAAVWMEFAQSAVRDAARPGAGAAAPEVEDAPATEAGEQPAPAGAEEGASEAPEGEGASETSAGTAV